MKPSTILVITLFTFSITACFSPWTGDESALGEVRIGGGTALTMIPAAGELANMTYKVHFSGPGGSFDREFGPAGGVERLSPGTWRLTVKAYNNEPRLRGITDTSITISGGGSHVVTLETCIGIKSEVELTAALGSGLTAGGYTFGHDNTIPVKGDLLVLENDITLTGAFPMNTGTTPLTPVTIIAEPGTSRKIDRGSSTTINISVTSGETLNLGRAGETGTLIIDCNNSAAPKTIETVSGGYLNLAGNVSFINVPYTVTFDHNDTTSTTTPLSGSSITTPPTVTYTSHYFLGWYTAASGGSKVSFPYVPAGNVTLYAHWIKDSIANAAEWKEAITAVNGSPGTYSFAITGSFGLDAAGTGTVNNPDPVSGVNLTLTGSQTITLNNGQQGSLLRVASGVTLTLNGPTLAGKADNTNNNAALVNVIGTFTLQSGKIIGNTNTASGGGVSSTGTFTMSAGSSIEGCRAASGGGVYIGGGTFNFNGGTIGGTTADRNIATQGGGVFVYTGNFTMSGSALIQNNATTTPTNNTNNGGGVYVAGGSFAMSGGSIQGDGTTLNAYSGGGVYVAGGSFALSGTGTIGGSSTGNKTSNNGGGVYIGGTSTFSMTGGTISYNDAGSNWGGGLYYNSSSTTAAFSAGTISNNKAYGGAGASINAGTFTMSGTSSGTVIKSNTATGDGGGMYVYNSAFIFSGGTIGGSGAGNTAAGWGGGVYIAGSGTLSMPSGSGSISYNTAARGGGVYYDSSSTTSSLTAGTISNNTATGASGNGGGVYVGTGTLTLTGTASISGNKAEHTSEGGGGGVYVYNNSTVFKMTGGTITQNEAPTGKGGGVYVNNAKFEMSGGTIGGTAGNANKAINGGGVYLYKTDNSASNTAIEMSSTAEISYNIANGSTNSGFNQYGCGGGVFILSGTSSGVNFTMSGNAKISNNTAQGTGTETIDGASKGAVAKGGGVYLANRTSVRLTINSSGVQITGNTAVNGGGVYLDNGLTSNNATGGKLELTGTATTSVINTNTVSNVYLYAGEIDDGASGAYTPGTAAW